MPLLTISGTARLGELGNPWFFRFFPSDSTVKVAHARYVVEKLGASVEDEGIPFGRRQEGVAGAEVDEVGLDEVDAPVHDDLLRRGRGAANGPDHVGEAVAELERVEVPDGEE